MKTVDEWVDGEDGLWALTCTVESDHTPEQLKKVVARIQNDALWHAANVIHDISRGTKSEDRAIAIDEARKLVADEAKQVAEINKPLYEHGANG